MNDEIKNDDLKSYDSFFSIDSVVALSQEFERDARRYNRAFTEQQEVSTK